MITDFRPERMLFQPALTGKWIRTTRLQTFDFKPDEWVAEAGDSAYQKYLQLNSDKTYSSNQVNCGECKIELLRDTLYVKHSAGFYKFPVLLLNDSLLHLKTNIDQPAYSLPNTGTLRFCAGGEIQEGEIGQAGIFCNKVFPITCLRTEFELNSTFQSLLSRKSL